MQNNSSTLIVTHIPPPTLKNTISSERILAFTEQLLALLEAGIPLFKGILILARQEKEGDYKQLLLFFSDRLYAGFSFFSSLSYYKNLFNSVYLSLVQAGEYSGKLSYTLSYLVKHLKKIQVMKRSIRMALIYPAIVLSVAIVVIGILLLWVVPRFEVMFKSSIGIDHLPIITQIFFGMSRILLKHFTLCISMCMLVLMITIYAVRLFFKKIKNFKNLKYIPFIGDLLLNANLARFTHTLFILLNSEIPILNALELSKDTCSLEFLKKGMAQIGSHVRNGHTLSKAIRFQKIFPESFSSLVEIGEESGNLQDLLFSLSKTYQDQVDDLIKKITTLFEPLVIIFLACIVGSIVLSLFLPMLHLIQNFGHI